MKWQCKQNFWKKICLFWRPFVSLAPFLVVRYSLGNPHLIFSNANAGGKSSNTRGAIDALATTVFGLVDAIPALVGYNYIKSQIREFQTDMDGFATEMLATAELQYRRLTNEKVGAKNNSPRRGTLGKPNPLIDVVLLF